MYSLKSISWSLFLSRLFIRSSMLPSCIFVDSPGTSQPPLPALPRCCAVPPIPWEGPFPVGAYASPHDSGALGLSHHIVPC